MINEERQNLIAELRHPRQRNERYYEPLCARAADEIERLAAQDDRFDAALRRVQDTQDELEEATVCAEHLAISLAARWYPEASEWKPLSGDLIGLLIQIDNMTTEAVRAQSNAEPVADEEAVNAAFDKWAETRGYGRMKNRLSFQAGVAFGLRHHGD